MELVVFFTAWVPVPEEASMRRWDVCRAGDWATRIGTAPRKRLCAASGRKEGDSIGTKRRVPGDDRQALDLSLGDQHPVEGVFVMAGQGGGGE